MIPTRTALHPPMPRRTLFWRDGARINSGARGKRAPRRSWTLVALLMSVSYAGCTDGVRRQSLDGPTSTGSETDATSSPTHQGVHARRGPLASWWAFAPTVANWQPPVRIALRDAPPLQFVYVPGWRFASGLSRPLGPSHWVLDSQSGFNLGPKQAEHIQHGLQVADAEITIRQWIEVMGDRPRDQPGADCGDDCPVDGVSWWSALAFADALNARAGIPRCFDGLGRHCSGEAATGNWGCLFDPNESLSERIGECRGYRLLTSAEWELAARGGTATETFAGDLEGDRFVHDGLPTGAYVTESHITADDVLRAFGHVVPIDPQAKPVVRLPDSGRRLQSGCTPNPAAKAVAWYCWNATVDQSWCEADGVFRQREPGACLGPQPVRGRQPNAFGIYDMLGNASEWTLDGYPRARRAMATGTTAAFNPMDGASGRVVRGGSWRNGVFQIQAGIRNDARMFDRAAGIRIGRTVPVPTSSSD